MSGTEKTVPQEHHYDDWEHRHAVKNLTAVFASQVYVQPLADGLIRLNFGETNPVDLEPTYHTAVVVSARNGLELANLISRISFAVLVPPQQPAHEAPTEERSGG